VYILEVHSVHYVYETFLYVLVLCLEVFIVLLTLAETEEEPQKEFGRTM